MTIKEYLAVIIVMVLFRAEIFAQTEKATQVSFIYPIGTAGANSVEYSNKFSFNVIAGVNGGVNGFEFGSVFNYNKGDIKGTQIAGVTNITLGNNSGTMISGVANISHNDSKGVMISGVTNFISGSNNGTMISGVANLAQKDTKGAMISGVLNSSRSHKGLQLSTINIASEGIDGMQLGVVNIAKKAKGAQIGIVNIASESDSIIPIGIINIIKGGYYAAELSTNELLLTNFSFKMGVEKLHTVFRAGAGSFNDKMIFSTGIGLGSIIPIKNNHKFNVELICDDIIYDNNWSGLNLLNQLNFHYQYQLSNCISIKAGPGIRNYVTDKKVNGEFNTIDVPYTIIESTGDKVKTSTWIGMNAGVVVTF